MRRFSIAETFPVTSFLLLFIIAFFALELVAHYKHVSEFPEILWGNIDPGVTSLLGSLDLIGIRQGEYWRALAAAFLHGNLIHVLLNGLVLWDMGRLCEPFLSSWKFLVVYVASALGGSAASIAYSRFALPVPFGEFRSSVGASGALSGLVGLLLVYSIRRKDTELRDGLLRWIAMIVIMSFAFRGIDHAGHAGGFAVGCLFGLSVDSYIASRDAARWRYPGYASVALVLVSLGFAVAHYLAGRQP